MSFSIAPKAAAAPVEGQLHGTTAPKSEARERAMARLLGNNSPAQTAPVADASNVSVEEMGAIKSSESVEEAVEERQPRNDVPAEEVAAEPAKAEAAKEEPKVPEDKLSAQYAQLARKEKAIRQQALQFKQQQEAFAKREAELAAREAKLSGNSENMISRDLIAKDPLKFLEESGLTYEQITERMLNGPSYEARQQQQLIQDLQAKIAKLEEGQNSTQKTIEESQKQQYNQAINQIKNEARQLVSSGEEFELINSTGSVDDVVELIEKTFEADGVLLSVEEAARAVEEYLEQEALKLTKLQKIQKKLSPQAVAKPESKVSSEQAASPQKQPTMKTLTNSVASTRTLTPRERALLAFEGKLK